MKSLGRNERKFIKFLLAREAPAIKNNEKTTGYHTDDGFSGFSALFTQP